MDATTLKAKLARQPFRSFVIELTSGGQIVIGKESELFFPRSRPELVIAFSDDGLQHEFEFAQISRLVEA